MKAVRVGWHTSSRSPGTSQPKARSISADPRRAAGAIIRLVHIDLGVEENLDGERRLHRNEEPFDEAPFVNGKSFVNRFAASTLSTSNTMTTPSSSARA